MSAYGFATVQTRHLFVLVQTNVLIRCDKFNNKMILLRLSDQKCGLYDRNYPEHMIVYYLLCSVFRKLSELFPRPFVRYYFSLEVSPWCHFPPTGSCRVASWTASGRSPTSAATTPSSTTCCLTTWQDETEKVIWDKWKEESRRKIDSNFPPLYKEHWNYQIGTIGFKLLDVYGRM